MPKCAEAGEGIKREKRNKQQDILVVFILV